MIIDKINNWLNLSKQYFFTYSEGFFRLSYLSNSPELIISSSKNLPFMKIDAEKQILYTDNPFIKGELCYVELEKGLWTMNSRMRYKNNVSYTPVYDATLDANFYCLAINSIENNLKTDFYHFNNHKIENKSISFLKPNADFINCHFKGSFENQYIIYFDKEWAQCNLLSNTTLSPILIDLFENEKIGFVNYKFNEKTYENCIETFHTIFNQANKPNLLELKKNTYAFFDIFINSIEDLKSLQSNRLNLNDRIKIQKIELFLINTIYAKFCGIELLSQEFKISPTKLKTDFKNLYGVSIFKYYQNKQMELALSLITQDNLMIKEVAKLFQYENTSKFSKAFEKFHKFLPSKAVQNKL